MLEYFLKEGADRERQATCEDFGNTRNLTPLALANTYKRERLTALVLEERLTALDTAIRLLADKPSLEEENAFLDVVKAGDFVSAIAKLEWVRVDPIRVDPAKRESHFGKMLNAQGGDWDATTGNPIPRWTALMQAAFFACSGDEGADGAAAGGRAGAVARLRGTVHGARLRGALDRHEHDPVPVQRWGMVRYLLNIPEPNGAFVPEPSRAKADVRIRDKNNKQVADIVRETCGAHPIDIPQDIEAALDPSHGQWSIGDPFEIIPCPTGQAMNENRQMEDPFRQFRDAGCECRKVSGEAAAQTRFYYISSTYSLNRSNMDTDFYYMFCPLENRNWGPRWGNSPIPVGWRATVFPPSSGM